MDTKNSSTDKLDTELFEQDSSTLQKVVAQSIDCLLPFEIEDFRDTGQLDEEQKAHLYRCDSCSSLLACVPRQENLDAFVLEVRKPRKSLLPNRSKADVGTLRKLS
jgi:hypothetical protein